MTFARVMTLGEGRFSWSTRVLATTYAGTEARTIHEDGAIVAWTEDGAVRTCVRTSATDFAAWVDERLALLEHRATNEFELHAIDEDKPRWKVKHGGWGTKLIVLPCKTMFWLQGHAGCGIYSLADGSLLEETGWTWVAISRSATYRCTFCEHQGEIVRTWHDADGNEEVEYAPSTYSWMLDHDGKRLVEYRSETRSLPRDAWFADDNSSVTIVLDTGTVTRSLPDLRELEAGPPKPKEIEPPVVSKPATFADVPEIPTRDGVTDRWGVTIAEHEAFSETFAELIVSNGDEVRFYDRENKTTPQKKYIDRRAGSGHNHIIALGERCALVIERIIEPASPSWASGPPTRQLRFFRLDTRAPHLVRVLATRDLREVRSSVPVVALSRDATLAVEGCVGDPVVRVWDLRNAEITATIDLTAEDDRVKKLAFGEGGRFFIETTRGRVFGYAAER